MGAALPSSTTYGSNQSFCALYMTSGGRKNETTPLSRGSSSWILKMQNASRFTGPKHATVATQIHPRRQLCAGQGVAQGSALLPGACRRVAAGVVGVRAACELRFACTRRHTWRLGEVLSVESVLIAYTLHRANLTGWAGWYARRRRGGAPRSFQERMPMMSSLILFGVKSMRDP